MTRNKEACISLFARLLLSLIFLYSGTVKLISPGATIAYIEHMGLPLPAIAYAVALVVELGLAVALVIGYKTTGVAIAMGVFALATALAFHSNFAEKVQVISFLKNSAICGGLLQVIASGPGRFSLDARQAGLS